MVDGAKLGLMIHHPIVSAPSHPCCLRKVLLPSVQPSRKEKQVFKPYIFHCRKWRQNREANLIILSPRSNHCFFVIVYVWPDMHIQRISVNVHLLFLPSLLSSARAFERSTIRSRSFKKINRALSVLRRTKSGSAVANQADQGREDSEDTTAPEGRLPMSMDMSWASRMTSGAMTTRPPSTF